MAIPGPPGATCEQGAMLDCGSCVRGHLRGTPPINESRVAPAWFKSAEEKKAAGSGNGARPETTPNRPDPQTTAADPGNPLEPHSAQYHLGVACLQHNAQLLPGVPDDL